jgi:threonine dehydrogenase-like Zn-dependent dehydrogenase
MAGVKPGDQTVIMGGGPVGLMAGKARPSFIVSHELPLDRAPEAYRNFDSRENGWTKVVLHP